MSKHIASSNITGHGHINPTLEIVRELVRRGHRVSYAVVEEFATAVRTAGATPVVYPTLLPTSATADQWPEEAAPAMNLFLDETINILPLLRKHFGEDRPDLVCWDIGAWQGLVLALQWKVPAVQTSPTFVGWDGWDEMQPADPAVDEFWERLTGFLSGEGISLPAKEFAGKPERAIATIPRAFQFFGDTIGGHVVFAGPMIGDRSFQGSWSAPDDRPVLLISLGSAYTDRPDFYRACFAAFGGSRWRVVLNVGRYLDPGTLGTPPANFEIHQGIPQLSMLASASVFVTHGGMGSTMEGLYFRVPLVVVPQAAEQFMNAARVRELGLGVTESSDSSDALRAAVDTAHDSTATRERLAWMGEQIDEAGGRARRRRRDRTLDV